MFVMSHWYLWFRRIKWFLFHRWTRYALAWMVTLGAAAEVTYYAWTFYDKPKRVDGNDGHTSVDFGGQWIMGRMLVEGKGRYLYERTQMREVLRKNYPRSDEGTDKEGQRGDADELMWFSLGDDDEDVGKAYASCVAPFAGSDSYGVMAIIVAGKVKGWNPEKMHEMATKRVLGGAVYPPVNALYNYPIALLPPQPSYRMRQILEIGLAILCGLGISLLSRGRIWTPIATTLILYYPDFYANQILAQNATISLCILIYGWLLIHRGRSFWGGAVWGLFSFKPTWAMPFFFVLLLTRRWKAALAMIGVGALLGLATLPFVGVHSWFEWLEAGKEASWGHRIYRNWIMLSRNLFGLPRRFMVDFDLPYDERDTLEINIVCWAVYLFVAEITVRLLLLRGKRAKVVGGAGAAFVLLSGWLCCLQFMYYDALLSVLPIFVLFLVPREYLQPDYLSRRRLEWQHFRLKPWGKLQSAPDRETAEYTTGNVGILRLPAAGGYGWIKNPFLIWPIIGILAVQNVLTPLGYTSDYEPYNTYFLLVLWIWCAWLWTRQLAAARRAEPAVVEARAVANEKAEEQEFVSPNGAPVVERATT